jgi:hypothetical protein
MIILGMPLFAWIGVLVFILIIIQINLGIRMASGKNLLKYHRINAIAITILATIHVVFALLFLFGKYVF